MSSGHWVQHWPLEVGWGFQPYRVHLLWHAHLAEPFPPLFSRAPGRFSLHVGQHSNECASSLGVLVRVLNPASWKNAPKLISLPRGSAGKDSACNVGDLGWIPGLGRSPGKANGNLLQYSCLENSMGRGTLWVTVHGVQGIGHE